MYVMFEQALCGCQDAEIRGRLARAPLLERSNSVGQHASEGVADDNALLRLRKGLAAAEPGAVGGARAAAVAEHHRPHLAVLVPALQVLPHRLDVPAVGKGREQGGDV